MLPQANIFQHISPLKMPISRFVLSLDVSINREMNKQNDLQKFKCQCCLNILVV
jgi:hypothetical protein